MSAQPASARPAPKASVLGSLDAAGVPHVSLSDACRSCQLPCSEEEADGDRERFWKPLDLDYSTPLLGSLKGNAGRTVIVATGKSDWPHSVTDEADLLAYSINKSYEDRPIQKSTVNATSNPTQRRNVPNLGGFGDGWDDKGEARQDGLSILCGSMQPFESHTSDVTSGGGESVMIFPDYKVVSNVTKQRTAALVREHLSLSEEQPTQSLLQAHTLPYRAVILICSHKRRDNRCHVTAPHLIASLTEAIEALGHDWHVDTSGNDAHFFEEVAAQSAFNHDQQLRRLTEKTDSSVDKHIGIFKVSHIGGHKFSAQMLLWLPNGVCVWYARVRPRDAPVIVQTTIVQGKVISDLLRGGTSLAGRSGGNIWQW